MDPPAAQTHAEEEPGPSSSYGLGNAASGPPSLSGGPAGAKEPCLIPGELHPAKLFPPYDHLYPPGYKKSSSYRKSMEAYSRELGPSEPSSRASLNVGSSITESSCKWVWPCG